MLVLIVVTISGLENELPKGVSNKKVDANKGELVSTKPVHCTGQWTTLSACSAKCGGGEQTRTYTVKVKAVNGTAIRAQDCMSDFSIGQTSGLPSKMVFDGQVQKISCNNVACSIDCVGSESADTACDAQGIKMSTYVITTKAQFGGKQCAMKAGTITKTCKPVDCVGSESTPGACSKKCGGGVQTSTYVISTQAKYGGVACKKVAGVKTYVCNTQKCPSVDCVATFSAWSECSAKCAGGTQTAMYAVSTFPAFGGKACDFVGGYKKSQACNTQNCPPVQPTVSQTADVAVAAIVADADMLKALSASVPAGSRVEITKIEATVTTAVTTPGTPSDFGSAAAPTPKLTAVIAGAAAASGVTVAEIGAITVGAGRRRLLAGVKIGYTITTTPAKAKAAKAATTAAGFAASLATATTAAAKAKGVTYAMATPTVAAPTVSTKVAYKTITANNATAKAAIKTASVPAAFTAALVTSLKKVGTTVSAADIAAKAPVDTSKAVNCVGSYGAFSACTKICDKGTQSRKYAVTTAAANGGWACLPAIHTQDCNAQPCPKVDCAGTYGAFGACIQAKGTGFIKAKCGKGMMTSKFTMTSTTYRKEGGGAACPAATKTMACDMGACASTAGGGGGKTGKAPLTLDYLFFEDFEDGKAAAARWKGNDRLRGGKTSATFVADPHYAGARGNVMRMNRCVWEGEAFSKAAFECTAANPCLTSFWVLQTGGDVAFQGFSQAFAGSHTWTASVLHEDNYGAKGHYESVLKSGGRIKTGVKDWQHMCFVWPEAGRTTHHWIMGPDTPINVVKNGDLNGPVGVTEVQTVTTAAGADDLAGTFTLTFGGQTTAAMAKDATATAATTAINALSTVTDATVARSAAKTATFGYVYTVTFAGTLPATGDAPAMTCGVTSLTGTTPTCVVAETAKGVAGVFGKPGYVGNWGVNNAKLSIVDLDGRKGVLKVADGGSFSDIFQNIVTVKGANYDVSFDVWADESIANTAGAAACSTVDSNGLLVVRDGFTTQLAEKAAGLHKKGHCGGTGVNDGKGAAQSCAKGKDTCYGHCHGFARFCPTAAKKWITVKGTFTALSAKTAIALHGESAWYAAFDKIAITLGAQPGADASRNPFNAGNCLGNPTDAELKAGKKKCPSHALDSEHGDHWVHMEVEAWGGKGGKCDQNYWDQFIVVRKTAGMDVAATCAALKVTKTLPKAALVTLFYDDFEDYAMENGGDTAKACTAANVVACSTTNGVAEVQTVTTAAGAADMAGTFKLSFGGQTTTALAKDITATAAATAINALSTVTGATVTAAAANNGFVYTITMGAVGDVAAMTCASALTGTTATCKVAEATKGAVADADDAAKKGITCACKVVRPTAGWKGNDRTGNMWNDPLQGGATGTSRSTIVVDPKGTHGKVMKMNKCVWNYDTFSKASFECTHKYPCVISYFVMQAGGNTAFQGFSQEFAGSHTNSYANARWGVDFEAGTVGAFPDAGANKNSLKRSGWEFICYTWPDKDYAPNLKTHQWASGADNPPGTKKFCATCAGCKHTCTAASKAAGCKPCPKSSIDTDHGEHRVHIMLEAHGSGGDCTQLYWDKFLVVRKPHAGANMKSICDRMKKGSISNGGDMLTYLFWDDFEDGELLDDWRPSDYRGVTQGVIKSVVAQDPYDATNLAMKMNRCIWGGEVFSKRVFACTKQSPCIAAYWVLQNKGNTAFQGFSQGFHGSHTWTAANKKYWGFENTVTAPDTDGTDKHAWTGNIPDAGTKAAPINQKWNFVCFQFPDMVRGSGSGVDHHHWIAGANSDPKTCKRMEAGNVVANPTLDGPVTTTATMSTITKWGTNNALLTIETIGGKAGVLKVADMGSFTDIFQNIKTVKGASYAIKYDVWADSSISNTANKGHCSTADSNGQLIVRDGWTKQQAAYGTSHCGGSDDHVTTGKAGGHCHGETRFCPSPCTKEVQTVATSAGADDLGGTFTLSFGGQTTTALAAAVSAADMATAINAMSSVTGATVTRGDKTKTFGYVYTITMGTADATDMTCAATALTTSASLTAKCVVAEKTKGVSTACGAGAWQTVTGTFRAPSDKTTIALHSESGWYAAFDNIVIEGKMVVSGCQNAKHYGYGGEGYKNCAHTCGTTDSVADKACRAKPACPNSGLATDNGNHFVHFMVQAHGSGGDCAQNYWDDFVVVRQPAGIKGASVDGVCAKLKKMTGSRTGPPPDQCTYPEQCEWGKTPSTLDYLFYDDFETLRPGKEMMLNADLTGIKCAANTVCTATNVAACSTTNGVAEVQTVTTAAVAADMAGTFKLSFGGQTTTALTAAVSAADMATAINALSTATGATVTAAAANNGFVYTITLGKKNEAAMTCDKTSLTGTTTTCVVAEATQGKLADSADSAKVGITCGCDISKCNLASWGKNNAKLTIVDVSFSPGTKEVQTVTTAAAAIGMKGAFRLSFGGKTTAAIFTNNGVAEVQTVTTSAGGLDLAGTFTLSFGGQTTTALAVTVSGADMATAINALSTVTGATVARSAAINNGFVYTLTMGAVGDVAAMTCGAGSLTGTTPACVVAEATKGASADAVATTAADVAKEINALSTVTGATVTAAAANNGFVYTITMGSADAAMMTCDMTAAKEVQTVTTTAGADDLGGTFTIGLGGKTTSAIAFGATAGAVRTAVSLLSTVAAGVTVTASAKTNNGYVYTITLGTTDSGLLMAADGGSLTGTTPTITAAKTTTGFVGLTGTTPTCVVAEATKGVAGSTVDAVGHTLNAGGRKGVVKVADGGSFSDIFQTMITKPFEVYKISFDVYADKSVANTASKAFCSSGDQNGMAFIRDGHTKQQAAYGTSHCGGSDHTGKTSGDQTNVVTHCHGLKRFCASEANKWVTVEGTFKSEEYYTTIALHSESAMASYYDKVSVKAVNSIDYSWSGNRRKNWPLRSPLGDVTTCTIENDPFKTQGKVMNFHRNVWEGEAISIKDFSCTLTNPCVVSYKILQRLGNTAFQGMCSDFAGHHTWTSTFYGDSSPKKGSSGFEGTVVERAKIKKSSSSEWEQVCYVFPTQSTHKWGYGSCGAVKKYGPAACEATPHLNKEDYTGAHKVHFLLEAWGNMVNARGLYMDEFTVVRKAKGSDIRSVCAALGKPVGEKPVAELKELYFDDMEDYGLGQIGGTDDGWLGMDCANPGPARCGAKTKDGKPNPAAKVPIVVNYDTIDQHATRGKVLKAQRGVWGGETGSRATVSCTAAAPCFVSYWTKAGTGNTGFQGFSQGYLGHHTWTSSWITPMGWGSRSDADGTKWPSFDGTVTKAGKIKNMRNWQQVCYIWPDGGLETHRWIAGWNGALKKGTSSFAGSHPEYGKKSPSILEEHVKGDHLLHVMWEAWGGSWTNNYWDDFLVTRAPAMTEKGNPSMNTMQQLCKSVSGYTSGGANVGSYEFLFWDDFETGDLRNWRGHETRWAVDGVLGRTANVVIDDPYGQRGKVMKSMRSVWEGDFFSKATISCTQAKPCIYGIYINRADNTNIYLGFSAGFAEHHSWTVSQAKGFGFSGPRGMVPGGKKWNFVCDQFPRPGYNKHEWEYNKRFRDPKSNKGGPISNSSLSTEHGEHYVHWMGEAQGNVKEALWDNFVAIRQPAGEKIDDTCKALRKQADSGKPPASQCAYPGQCTEPAAPASFNYLFYDDFEGEDVGNRAPDGWKGNDRTTWYAYKGGRTMATVAYDPLKMQGKVMKMNRCVWEGEAFSRKSFPCTTKFPCLVSFNVLQNGDVFVQGGYGNTAFQGFSQGFPGHHSWTSSFLHKGNNGQSSQFDGTVQSRALIKAGVKNWQQICYVWPLADFTQHKWVMGADSDPKTSNFNTGHCKAAPTAAETAAGVKTCPSASTVEEHGNHFVHFEVEAWGNIGNCVHNYWDKFQAVRYTPDMNVYASCKALGDDSKHMAPDLKVLFHDNFETENADVAKGSITPTGWRGNSRTSGFWNTDASTGMFKAGKSGDTAAMIKTDPKGKNGLVMNTARCVWEGEAWSRSSFECTKAYPCIVSYDVLQAGGNTAFQGMSQDFPGSHTWTMAPATYPGFDGTCGNFPDAGCKTQVLTAAVKTAGAGYTVGDIVTLQGGGMPCGPTATSGCASTAATVTVDSVTSAIVKEVQTVTTSAGAADLAGTFTLTVNGETSAALGVTTTAGAMTTAINALTTVTGATVTTTAANNGLVYTITLSEGVDAAAIKCTKTFTGTTPGCVVAETTKGMPIGAITGATRKSAGTYTSAFSSAKQYSATKADGTTSSTGTGAVFTTTSTASCPKSSLASAKPGLKMADWYNACFEYPTPTGKDHHKWQSGSGTRPSGTSTFCATGHDCKGVTCAIDATTNKQVDPKCVNKLACSRDCSKADATKGTCRSCKDATLDTEHGAHLSRFMVQAHGGGRGDCSKTYWDNFIVVRKPSTKTSNMKDICARLKTMVRKAPTPAKDLVYQFFDDFEDNDMSDWKGNDRTGGMWNAKWDAKTSKVIAGKPGDTSAHLVDDPEKDLKSVVVNGDLNGPVTDGTKTSRIPSWGSNNAKLTIETVALGGRTGVLKVSDAGSFSDIFQNLATVAGTVYTVSFDVWADASVANTAKKPFCSSADSNGQLIIRDGHTDQQTEHSTSHCGNSKTVATTGKAGGHCHGQKRFCPTKAKEWQTVTGSFVAQSDKTAIALHGESAWWAAFDKISVTPIGHGKVLKHEKCIWNGDAFSKRTVECTRARPCIVSFWAKQGAGNTAFLGFSQEYAGSHTWAMANGRWKNFDNTIDMNLPDAGSKCRTTADTEVQTVSTAAAADDLAGTFTLSFGGKTTAALAVAVSAADAQIAINTLTTGATVTRTAKDAGTKEVQVVTTTASADDLAGTFTLSFGGLTSTPMAKDITAAAATTAINAMSSVTGATVTRSAKTAQYGYVFTITMGAADAALMTCGSGSLTGTTVTCGVEEGTKGRAATNGYVFTIKLGATDAAMMTCGTASLAGTTATCVVAEKTKGGYVQSADTSANGVTCNKNSGWQFGCLTYPSPTAKHQTGNHRWTAGKADAPAGSSGYCSSGTLCGKCKHSCTAATKKACSTTNGVKEVQTVTTAAATNDMAGTFTLSFGGQVTSALAKDITAAAATTAVNALSTVTGATVTRGNMKNFGYVYTITMGAAGDVAAMTCASALTGTTATCVVAEKTKGVLADADDAAKKGTTCSCIACMDASVDSEHGAHYQHFDLEAHGSGGDCAQLYWDTFVVVTAPKYDRKPKSEICAIMKKLGNGDNVPPPDRCTFPTQCVNTLG